MSKSRLGRGLANLLSSEDLLKDAPTGASLVDPKKIRPNRHQPRGGINDTDLDGLIATIREKGVLQPLTVRKTDDGFELIAGERRLRACLALKLKEVPVLIRDDVDEKEMLSLALIENLQREDLNAIDKARAYKQLMDEFGLTQAQVAVEVGESRSAVANTIRLLELPDEVRTALIAGKITAGHARAILAAGARTEQLAMLRAITSGDLNVRSAEARVKKKAPRIKKQVRSNNVRDLETTLKRALGTKVAIKETTKERGQVVIEYYSIEDFNRIFELLTDNL